MVRRLLLVLILSPVAALSIPANDDVSDAHASDAGNVLEAASFRETGRGATFEGCAEGDGDFLFGECPASPTGDESRWHIALITVSSPTDAAPAARGRTAVPKHGLGPILASLSDTLILSRPPPGAV